MAQIFNPQPAELKLIVDSSTSGTVYVGQAAIGTATSAAAWQIMKIVTSSGVTTITWAGGDQLFDKIWDNRSSLSYS